MFSYKKCIEKIVITLAIPFSFYVQKTDKISLLVKKNIILLGYL